MHKYIFALLVLVSLSSTAQVLNCTVTVNATNTGNENIQLFKTMQRQLNEFVNNTEWTSQKAKPQERINCGIFINIDGYNGELFNGSIQVQASRPVYGSTYETPIYNINDKDFTFQYLEFQNIIYSPTQFQSNLVSVIAFHINMILAVDADTFSPKGGEPYFDQAMTILNYSQSENFKGWKLADGLQSRFALIDNILSPTYKEYRTALYSYHRLGLDVMSDNQKDAKTAIIKAIGELNKMNRRRPNSYLLRTFFDAKSDEIGQIFSGGPNVNIAELKSQLNRMAPTYSSKWRKIKF